MAGAVGPAGLDALPQAFGVERVGEHDFDLCGGLLDADVGGEPFAGHDVQDGVGDAAGSGEMGDVVDPDLVALPFDPVRHRCRRDGCALWAGGQDEALTC